MDKRKEGVDGAGTDSQDALKDTVAEGAAVPSEPGGAVAVLGVGKTVLEESAIAPGHEETVLASSLVGVTTVEPAQLRAAEEAVAAEWANGDVILDLYEVAGLLGEGGMGKVYRVRHRGWNLDLAVKSPRAGYFQTEEQKQNFVRECETWIDLGLHPHTVSCYYVRTLGGIPRVFAEYVEGGSLADWIRSGKLYEGGSGAALKRILDVAIQFAWGLGYAHERGLIHQDVKPANVMLTPEGVAKVTDFGLAQARPVGEVEVPDGKGGTVLVRGRGMTPAYCSPEQAAGAELSRKTDIWSWGVSVLEMFTGGVTCAAGQAASQALSSHLETHQNDSRLPRMPRQVEKLLRQCFVRETSERPKDMPAVVEQLRACYRAVVGEAYGREEPKPAELLADALNNRAVSLLDLGKREAAERLFEEVLKSDPHHAEATYNRGLVLWRAGRLTDDALVKQLEEVRTSHVADWRDEYYLGLVHIERGDAEAAVKVLEEAMQMAPEDSEVQRACRTAGAGRGQWCRCVHVFDTSKKGQPYYNLAFTPDGRWGLSISHDGTLRLWELATGQCVRVFEGHTGRVISVTISPDGQWALSGSDDKTLRLWELATGQCVRVFEGHTGCVNSVSISPDGRWGLSGSDDKTLQLWELATGQCVRTFEGHKDTVRSVSISPEGRWGLSGGWSELRLWDLASGECVMTTGGYFPAISPDWRWALSVISGKTLRLWELTTGRDVRVFEGHTRNVNSVTISPDGRWGLSGSDDKTLRLWELTTGRCVRVFEGHTDYVSSVTISPDGRWGLSGTREYMATNDHTLRLWDLATGQCVRTFEEHKGSVGSVSISPDGRWVLSSSSSDQTLRLWGCLATGPTAPFAVTRPRSAVEAGRVAAQAAQAIDRARGLLGRGLAQEAVEVLIGVRQQAEYERHPVVLGLLREAGLSGTRIALAVGWCVRSLDGHTGLVHSVAISPDGCRALSGSTDKTLRLWDLATGKCLHTLKARDFMWMPSVRISPDGRWGLSGSWDERLRLWDLAEGKCVRVFEGHSGDVHSVAISPDGRGGLSGSKDKTLRLWNLATGQCVRVFEGHTERVNAVAIGPDGRWALSGSSDQTLRLWDLATGQCVRVFEGHGGSVRAVAISPDRRWGLSGAGLSDVSDDEEHQLARGDEAMRRMTALLEQGDLGAAEAFGKRFLADKFRDNSLRLWELTTGKCVRVLEGHTDWVNSVTISPDGSWGLSGSNDKTLRLWELATGQCVRVFEGHTEAVNSVAMSPDGSWVLSGSNDSTVRLWELAWDYGFPEPADWDAAAEPHLASFLALHPPRRSLLRRLVPTWSEGELQRLLTDLRYRGFGWLRPEGVRRELEKMTREWKGLPDLPWESGGVKK